jgi:hypothetical protein
MQGTLARGGFVRLAYRLGREAATGALSLICEDGAGHELYLRRGYLTFAHVAGLEAPLGRILVDAGVVDESALARGLAAARSGGPRLAGQALRATGAVSDGALDAALRRQAELRLGRLAAAPAASWRFDPHAPAPPAGRSGRPVSLTIWARRHLEAQVDSARARALRAELAAGFVLHKELCPDATECDELDRRILAALATARGLADIGRAAAPELRLLTFLAFLRGVGALEPAPATSERALRQAYHAAARQLHPDLHPDASLERRRALEHELARVTAAYRALTRP